MAIEIHCDARNDDLKDSNGEVLCPKCAKTTCCECAAPAEKLYCEDCAVEEFGEPELDSFNADTNADIGLVDDLAAAIRAGRRDDAEYLLDRIASGIDGWSDAVSKGRYSPRARRAA